MTNNSRIGSVGNESVDPASIPTDLFEIDTTNKLIKLKDGWNFGSLPESITDLTELAVLHSGSEAFSVRNGITTANLLYTLFAGVSTAVGTGIIESGSNSNGRWIKFGDGTLIQTTWVDIPGQAISTEVSGTRSWPTPFFSLDKKSFGCAVQVGLGSQAMVGLQAYNGIYDRSTVNYAGLYTYAYRYATNGTSGYVKYDVIGIGRWKA